MKLRELEARLVRMEGSVGHVVQSVAEASGVDFVCPLCGGHHVRVYFQDRGVDPSLKPSPRWKASGSTLDDLTITPSIHLNANAPASENVCRWHGFVTNGDAA